MMDIDTKELKSRYNLIDMAERHTTLSRETSTEYSGPCPQCGGDNRFHAKADGYFCRQCHPIGDKGWHDAIDFVQFVGLAHDFKSACDLLGGDTMPAPTTPKRTPEKKPGETWKSPLWQRETLAMLEDAQDRLLNSPDGEPGRAYLASRGFREDVALAFGLGFADVWHLKRKEHRAAIILPWQNTNVAAVQYRFIDSDLGHDERFGQKGGGDRLLFGMHLLKHSEADTLILCEGELNACSIWQIAYGDLPVHVISWGMDKNIQRSHVAELAAKVAGNYSRVIVWADEPDRATGAMNALGLPGVIALRSPRGLDANDLLKSGQLAPFIERLLQKHPIHKPAMAA